LGGPLEFVDLLGDAELPILALILTRNALPMIIGSDSGWLTLLGMIARPAATSLRTSSTSQSSRSATNRISWVMTPSRAYRICVTVLPSTARRGTGCPPRHSADAAPRRTADLPSSSSSRSRPSYGSVSALASIQGARNGSSPRTGSLPGPAVR
jgi:hypothetical protein